MNQKTSPTPIAYRPGVAADVLGVSRATIYEMIADGRLESRKIGSATLIAHAELERLFAAADLSDATKRARCFPGSEENRLGSNLGLSGISG